MGNKCEHYVQANDQISPNTKECEECEKKKLLGLHCECV